jgi:hypothetical protein
MFETANQNMSQASAKVGVLWCGLMHDSPMWPIHGQYQCGACGRLYPVGWDADRLTESSARRIPAARVLSFRSALLPLLIVLATLVASLARAADAGVVAPTDRAAMAFARYTAGLEQTKPWSLATVEIDASLAKLEKHGRLRAIRRLLPAGKPEYQILEISGDQTVKQQVIARYLTAEVRAADIASPSVAISPANYRFRYKGSVKIGDTTAYTFLIAPRKKGEGLIKGELWIDGESGAVVRQSGYLVKKPSMFVKRVDVTRETALRDGIAEARVTHLSVETRLVGRAELTILERPYIAPEHSLALNMVER